jgi:hypothetical protein
LAGIFYFGASCTIRELLGACARRGFGRTINGNANHQECGVLERGVAGLDWLAERWGRQSLLAPHLRTAERGEEAAFFYLRRNGFTVAAQR